jgi:hypothetical protein
LSFKNPIGKVIQGGVCANVAADYARHHKKKGLKEDTCDVTLLGEAKKSHDPGCELLLFHSDHEKTVYQEDGNNDKQNENHVED